MSPRACATGAVLAALCLVLAACGGPSGRVRSASRLGTVKSTTSTSSSGVSAQTNGSTAPSGGISGSPSGSSAASGTAGTAAVSPPRPSTTVATSAGPATTTTTTSASAPTGTGAYGYVTAGPTCPVQQSGQPCPPQPVSAQVEARDSAGATTASTHTDSSGRFVLPLPPGSYTLVVTTGSTYPRCPDTPVTVREASMTRADISCDSGMR